MEMMTDTSAGVKAMGIHLPLIDRNCNLFEEIVRALLRCDDYRPQNGDVIGITESLVARNLDMYVTVDEITDWLIQRFNWAGKVYVYNPIYSRNRFSLIWRAICAAVDEVEIIVPTTDEVGNYYKHPITGVDYVQYYKDIAADEKTRVIWACNQEHILSPSVYDDVVNNGVPIINCTLHPEFDEFWPFKTNPPQNVITLKDICSDKSEWGLLGTNLAGEDRLKLYPDVTHAWQLVENIQRFMKETANVDVEVMIYGDGAFKDPVTGIWEFADPVVSPVHTSGLIGSPSEIKLKYFIDQKAPQATMEHFTQYMYNEIKGNMPYRHDFDRQGTTPRRYIDLLGSMMDLVSGSGDKGTPVVVVQNYFKNYADYLETQMKD